MAKRYNDYKHWLAAEVLSESKIVSQLSYNSITILMAS